MARGLFLLAGGAERCCRAIVFFLTVLSLSLVLPFALGGCPAAIVGGLAAAGGCGLRRQPGNGGVGGSVDDFLDQDKYSERLDSGRNPAMQADLNVTVYEGRTLLTGMAPTPEVKAQAKGHRQPRGGGGGPVYDEVEGRGPPEGAWQGTKDAWITSRLRTELTFKTPASVRSTTRSRP